MIFLTMENTNNIIAVINTDKGIIKVKLFWEKTPVTCGNFVNLSQRGYYDGLTFHRVIPDFMIQGGCPDGTGTGSPGYNFEDEFHTTLRHESAGVLSMANAGPGTNGSQFFITHLDTPWLDDHHTVFGKILSNEDKNVVDLIEENDKIISISIDGKTKPLLDKISDRIIEWNKILDKKPSK